MSLFSNELRPTQVLTETTSLISVASMEARWS